MRYRDIDALRALAAYLVVWMHVAEGHYRLSPQVEAQGTSLFTLAHAVDAGRIGVITFFVISGFVIPSSLKGARLKGLRVFVIRRFWRLYPAYWLAVILGYWACRYLGNSPMAMTEVAMNFTMIQESLGYPSVMGHFWTLQTELLFYASCALLFAAGLLHRPWVAMAMSVSLAWVSGEFLFGRLQSLGPFDLNPVRIHNLFFLSFMFWGSLYRHWRDASYVKDWKLLGLIGAACCILHHPYVSLTEGLSQGNNEAVRYGLSHILGLTLFVAGALAFRFDSRRLAYLGEMSYSVYLFHPVLFYSGFWVLERLPPVFKQLHLAFYIAFYLVASTIFAHLVYRWVEKPAMSLGRRLSSPTRVPAQPPGTPELQPPTPPSPPAPLS